MFFHIRQRGKSVPLMCASNKRHFNIHLRDWGRDFIQAPLIVTCRRTFIVCFLQLFKKLNTESRQSCAGIFAAKRNHCRSLMHFYCMRAEFSVGFWCFTPKVERFHKFLAPSYNSFHFEVCGLERLEVSEKATFSFMFRGLIRLLPENLRF